MTSVPGDASRFSHQRGIVPVTAIIVFGKGMPDHVPLVRGLKPHVHDSGASILIMPWLRLHSERSLK